MPLSVKYNTCLKCHSIICSDLIPAHEIECHEINKSPSCFSHSFIKDDNLYMRIMIIKEDTPSNGKKFDHSMKGVRYCEEPDWVKPMKVSFWDRFIFLNEYDMIMCRIEGFSPVCVSTNQSREEVFIAAPSRGTPSSCILMYESGVTKFADDCVEPLLFRVRKLDNIKIGNEINFHLSALNYSDSFTLRKFIKRRYGSSLKIGAPFVFKNNDNFVINFLENVKCKVYESDKKDATCLLTEIKTTADDTHNEPLALPSIESVAQDLEKVSVADVAGSPVPSTPTSVQGKTKHSRSKKRKKRRSCSDITYSSIAKDFVESDIYFLCGETSHIEVCLETLNKEDKIIRATYYKDTVYYSIHDAIAMKIKGQLEGTFSFANCWSGIYLCGHTGTGKSRAVYELSTELDIPLITVSLMEWAKSNLTETEFVDRAFEQAKLKAPSLLFFDEIDSLCLNREGKRLDAFTISVYKIFSRAKTLSKPIIPICASILPGNRDLLTKYGRFDKEIVFSLPDHEKKIAILQELLLQYSHSLTLQDFEELAESAHGFSIADLSSLVITTVMESFAQWKESKSQIKELTLSIDHFRRSIVKILPSFLKNNNYTSVHEVHWSDIYGYEDVKCEIKKVLESYSRVTVDDDSLKNLILYGPPGCSKTMFVKAIVNETKFTYFPIKCSDLLSKYVGETEKSLNNVFDRAIMSAPSLIFMDEIDSLCGDREEQSGSLITELLSLFKYINSKGVMVVGATNRPQDVDEALFAPGYLEVALHIDLPDCASRCAMWQGLLSSVPAKDFDISSLCQKTSGFSGAEIMYVYNTAAQRLIDGCNEEEDKSKEIFLTQQTFEEVLLGVSPRTSSRILSAIQHFRMTRIRR